MLDEKQFEQINQALPLLGQAGPDLQREFQAEAYYAQIGQGKDIFVEGDRVNGIALLLSGRVRVYRIGESGREITLYRFGQGQSCILTANAILNQQNFPAIATVERDAEAVIIPSEAFQRWLARYEPWRAFVFDLLSQRLVSMMEIVDEVAFQRLDRRLAALLLARAQDGNPITITHQEIANELGSSREVISRLLADLAEAGSLELGRGEIRVLDRGDLEARQAW